MENTDQRFPIGKYKAPEAINQELRLKNLEIIKELPLKLKNLLGNITEESLKQTYRENGWTIAQVVNHIADSHLNAFVRFKLTLTEDVPTVKAYHENLWAETTDGKSMKIENSLLIIEGIHNKIVELLLSMKDSDFKREFYHPERKININLDYLLDLYAWHSEHHLAHIKIALSNTF